MAKPLVIVESVAKARTIAGFLGDGYDVRPSVGHIRDLPRSGLAIDVDDHFTPQTVGLPDAPDLEPRRAQPACAPALVGDVDRRDPWQSERGPK